MDPDEEDERSQGREDAGVVLGVKINRGLKTKKGRVRKRKCRRGVITLILRERERERDERSRPTHIDTHCQRHTLVHLSL